MYEEEASKFWSRFYDQHKDMFFKDRNWLAIEFPELFYGNYHFCAESAIETTTVLEVGCGVGNTVFPLLDSTGSKLFVYCCDFAENAVNLVKSNVSYDENRCHSFVCDVTNLPLQMPFEQNSLDFILLIFTLSAICPSKMEATLSALVEYLKPGGLLLFRDYGRYDLSQVRFKSGQCIEQNFYVRGDGTRVYFFTQGKFV
ncbi:unnamed protein product [Soboliphyme baturini]|uniref:Methyltransf_25 domain-containing protein n=1 Tax=Soboliphyme baturini TaxID=241478 RepID=A0A183IRG3_9BILA|nr:unnamed protein product [Soboliphyme baturini]